MSESISRIRSASRGRATSHLDNQHRLHIPSLKPLCPSAHETKHPHGTHQTQRTRARVAWAARSSAHAKVVKNATSPSRRIVHHPSIREATRRLLPLSLSLHPLISPTNARVELHARSESESDVEPSRLHRSILARAEGHGGARARRCSRGASGGLLRLVRPRDVAVLGKH